MAIAHLLQIEKTYIAAGSWGAALALLFAQAHPDKVVGMLLKSVFLADKKSLSQLVSNYKSSHPDLAVNFERFLDEHHIQLSSLTEDSNKAFAGGDFELKQKYAAAMYFVEYGLYDMAYTIQKLDPANFNESQINSAKIFAHYHANSYFIQDGQIMRDLDKLKDMPIYMIHGRYDSICTVEQAYALHRALPQSVLEIVPDSGHKLSPVSRRLANYMLDKMVLVP